MFSYFVTLYHRALNNKTLSSKERAFLKAIQGLIIGFIGDATPQLLNVYMMHGKFHITQSVVVALAVAFILGLLKLWNAQGDKELSPILDAYSQALEQKALGLAVDQNAPGGVTVPAISILIPSSAPITQLVHVALGASHPEQSSVPLDKMQAIPVIAPAATNDIPLAPVANVVPASTLVFAPAPAPAPSKSKKSQVAPASAQVSDVPTVSTPNVPLTN